MSFTDKDKELLKDFLNHDCKTCEGTAPLPFNGSPFEKTKALLARLESAEALHVAMWAYHMGRGEDKDFADAMDTWLKSKGDGV